MGLTRFENRPADKHHPCLWMQAGVVSRKFCEIDYDCSPCRFDKTLRRAALRNKKLREQGETPKREAGRHRFLERQIERAVPKPTSMSSPYERSYRL